MKITANKNSKIGLKQKLLVLCLLFALIVPLAGCDALRPQDSVKSVARYGEIGRSLALRMVELHPFRKAGTPEEGETANFILDELERLGIQAEKQEFTYQDPEGQTKDSANIVVEISGNGLQPAEVDKKNPLNESQEMHLPANLDSLFYIVGAHYDSYYSYEEAAALDAAGSVAELDENGNPINTGIELPPYVEADGIDDNAAAVASLLLLANNLKANPPAIDVRIIFFGAGHDNFAGASAYADSLTEDELASVHAMVNVSNIYAGDKVYAHAGQNSVIGGLEKHYSKRQSLYVCTDVYYNNILLTNNGFALFTNQSNCEREVANGNTAVYREWTQRESDHTPFDELDIPVVFFEAANYDYMDCDSPWRQITDPYFAGAEGVIIGSPYDSSKVLTEYFVPKSQLQNSQYFGDEENAEVEDDEAKENEKEIPYKDTIDALERRINNVTFIIFELCHFVPYGAELK